MLRWLGSILTGGVADRLLDAYQRRVRAQNDAERLAVEREIAHLEARQKTLAQGGRWITAVQVGFAMPFIFYTCKLVVWDKMLGLGATDPLSPELYDLQSTVIKYFFVSSGAVAIVRMAKR